MMITKWLQLWDSLDSVVRKNDSTGFYFIYESLYSMFIKSNENCYAVVTR